MQRKNVLRYSFFGVGFIAVGFLTAFFVDQGIASTALNSQNPQGNTDSVLGSTLADLVKSPDKNTDQNTVEGLTMFRGTPSRTFYGKGPIPSEPTAIWRYPEKPMCMFSTAEHERKQWCGSGWTGEPVVWERPDGITELIFGAYDGAVHFVDAATGKDLMPKFQTGDLIKGSVTLDPNGFPLIYFGSRDNKLRVVALDRDKPTELWSLDAYAVKGKWNDDWDGNPVMKDDVLFEGGENGWFFATKMNRTYGADGKVTVAPNILFETPAYNDELIKNIGDEDVSIEDSLTFFGDRVYFANSGGRVLGFDISRINDGVAPQVFDFWTGDDTDATIVVDDKGMLYVSSELQRFNARSAKLGQFMKLNPYTTGDPYLWGVQVPKGGMPLGGLWATPALSGNYLYTTTHSGNLLVVDKETGEVTYKEFIGEHAWSSPIVIDGTLLVSTCEPGGFRQYSLTDPAKPTITNVMLHTTGSCIESTPAVWKGSLYVGSRDGYFYKFANKQ